MFSRLFTDGELIAAVVVVRVEVVTVLVVGVDTQFPEERAVGKMSPFLRGKGRIGPAPEPTGLPIPGNVVTTDTAV